MHLIFILLFSLPLLGSPPVIDKGRIRPASLVTAPERKEEPPFLREAPLAMRLTHASGLRMLPSRTQKGEWISLQALEIEINDGGLIPVPNFTPYSDLAFEGIREAYLAKDQPLLWQRLESAYHENFNSPSRLQLRAEEFYFKYPLKEILIGLYLLGFLGVSFTFHTALLAMRCYILERPPVSNMLETLIYVPWVAVLASLILYRFYPSKILRRSASLLAVLLLLLLQFFGPNDSMENVQAVLNSQFWLLIHVLMIVGSYGLFLLGGILGHIYLIAWLLNKNETMKTIAKVIPQTLYVGLALLIPGTILGGIWAAQSWGRFWDWDPKESWAFISACIYLLCIHAYRFRYIADFGLAVGSILGLHAIAFTWYGVNYILGKGLHSYGFGSGGEIYYYAAVLVDLLFLSFTIKRFIRYANPPIA